MKLKGINGEAWVTCAATDDDAKKCIVLARSLKRVSSNRSVVIMTSTKVSLNLRSWFYVEFDYVFVLEEDTNTANLKPEEFGKLSVLRLKPFQKCCFVSPNMMFLKNADDIFKSFENHSFACVEMDPSLSIFLVKPSLEAFDVLMKALGSRNGTPVTSYIQNWFRNQSSNLNSLTKENPDPGHAYIGPEYQRKISYRNQEGDMIPATEASIVQFLDDPTTIHEKSKDAKIGMIDLHVLNIWMELQAQAENDWTRIKDGSAMLYAPSQHDYDYRREPIAIVGMSCRYPGSNNLEEFWDLLFRGQDGTGNPPPFRWLKEQCARNRPDCRKTNAGFLNVPVDDFDAKFFGISPKEVLFMDPQHRLLHELIWEGLEDAAIDPLGLRGTNAGVFMGSWTNDYRDILSHAGVKEFYRVYMGNSIGAAAARISFLLGLTGPSVATESGCSSAMVAVHLACRSLLLGETNLALACGVNLLLHPFDKDEMPMVISPEGRCKTFDANADGFARGEGCGVLILKRLSDAIKDNDNIWALIRGSATSQEGVSRSMGTPTVHCESLAMELALHDSLVHPNDVSYVEAHGTGTVVGDPMEVSAIAKAYGSTSRDEPLIIGSVKTNVGHTESCSGITGIMKVVLAMHHDVIPPHRNFETLNPNINLDSVPARLPLEPVEWKQKADGKPRIAGVSSFGITGTDAHAIIEEAPKFSTIEIDLGMERPKHILKISAKTEEALNILLKKYAERIENSNEELSDICYTANTGRADFPWRTAIVGDAKEDIANKIKQGNLMKQETEEEHGKICFLFTGQGSQYPGMAKQLYDSSPVFKMHFDYCEGLLKDMYSVNIRDVLWGENKHEVSRTIYSQTSIFCVEYALLKLWESWGVKPDYVLGHSLGEFAAAVCAGVLEPRDALMLVAERSRLVDQLPTGKMLVIKAEKSTVDQAMKSFSNGQPNKILDFAAINSSQQTVVAGDSDVILEFAEYLTKIKNLKSIVLEATHAFHSKHMDPMLDSYRKVAETVKRKDYTNCEYISGMKGAQVGCKDIDADYWVQHTRQPVNFLQASKTAVELGCNIFVEIGPQPVLAALTMLNSDGVSKITCLPSLKKTENEWETILQTLSKLYLSGVNIDWKGFDKLYLRKKVRLPHYPFIGKKFWPDMLAATGNTIHPLLGTIIQNASSTRIFQNGLNLRSLEYVKDHAIGHTAVFPGAGYLEMALAAGLATVESSSDSLSRPTRPMMVENLKITAPLALEESKTCQVQVVVDFNTGTGIIRDDKADWDDLSVKIFHKLESKWLCHATASFVPLPRVEQINKTKVDKEVFSKLKELPSDETLIAQTYEKLASVGLKFGPTFQSVECVWRNSETDDMLAKLKLPDSNAQPENQSYVLHPAVLDAMIQSIMMRKYSDKIKKRLYVPISIGKFLWISNFVGTEMYVYVTGEGADVQAILMDEDANVIASMSHVELIETTVKAVESVIEQQTSMMPDLWEESWRAKLGPMQHRLPDELLSANMYTSEFKEHINQTYNTVPQEKEAMFETLEELVFLWMLNSLYDCGWEPKPNEAFAAVDLVKGLGIEIAHTKFVNYFLEVFSQQGFCRNRDGKWEIFRLPPSKEETINLLQSSEYGDALAREFDPTRLINKIGRNLADVFRGKQSPFPILFPENTKVEPSVAGFYDDYSAVFNIAAAIVDVEKQRITGWVEQMKAKDKKFVLRILEVGAGTGVFSSLVIPVFEELKIDYEYTYTDISAVFFPVAEKRFEKFASKMVFKKLDIEADPVSQGFCPGYYDYVIASDVIHATKNIHDSLQNCRKLLRVGGIIDIGEQIKQNRVITFIFGLMEGFWRYEDFRNDHCIIKAETWADCLQKSGYEKPVLFSSFHGRHGLITSWASNAEEIPKTSLTNNRDHTWLLFSREGSKLSDFLQSQLRSAGRKVVVIKPSSESKCLDFSSDEIALRPGEKSDFEELMQILKENECVVDGIVYLWALDKSLTEQEDILKPYFHLVQSAFALKQKRLPKLCAVTHGLVPVGDTDFSHFHPSTLWGFTKALRNENTDMNCRCIGVANEDAQLSASEMTEVFIELWSEDKEPQITYHNGSRHVAKFQPVKAPWADLTLPSGTNRYQLVLPETNSIGDLTFGPLEPLTLEPDEIEVQVYASALNFRDVFSVLKPSKAFEKVNCVGFDFSGVVKKLGEGVTKWKVGDSVFGINLNMNALPSHVKLTEEEVIAVPDDMTFCEAATLPAVVATTYYCLMEVAQITKDDTVLIHTASGGVGLCAIQLVQSVGAKIIATAGSKRKQNYLRSLGIEHIFNSRNTEYGDKILEVTNGRGVDVVLNSLTSEGFKEATLKACAKGARFVEMSKLSIWEPEEVRKLRPDVEYTVVDLSAATKQEWKRLLNKLWSLSDAKVVKPIPYVRFDAVNIREALQYLQKAKHIGKVVCVMPQLRFEDGQYRPYTPMFSDRSTYLITGGLGGIGMEVAKWMVSKGAKHVLLASRSPPKEQTQAVINEMNKNGANLIPVQLDVGNYDECKRLLKSIGNENGLQVPPLRGIMHAAGTLSDGLIVNQEWDKLSSTFNAKVKGTLNLHEITKDCELEHFVLFSSMASLFGPPGQSNHAAGNSFEDAFANYRHSVGLCVNTVNWGQWGEIGVAVEVDLPGMKALSTLQGISALEYVMKSQRLQTAVMNMESFVLFSKLSPQVAIYLDEKIWKAGSSSSASITIRSDEFWQQYDSKQDPSEKIEIIKENLKDLLRKILKLDSGEHIDDEANFQDMGVDSLMFVEIKNAVQALLGDRVTVSANSLRDCNNVKLLSEQLMKIIEGEDSEETPPSSEEVNELIREDCQLPEEINANGRPIKNLSEIRKVLLTGVTGTLGPYILKELTKLPQITEVYCLIRPTKSMTLEERLEKVLEYRGISNQVNTGKVKCIEGNVAQPNLGISENHWNDLIENIDAVFHCAVKADHLEFYRKRPSSSRVNDVRSVNISGTKNVLQFASMGQVKHVFMASSLLSVTATDEDDKLSESWPNISDLDNVTKFAYPISKFVGDMLMKEAVMERGIPGKVFRFPLIAGDSKTGKFNLDQNHLMLRYMYVLKKGVISSNPIPLMLLPVDICASLSVNIFFNEAVATESDIYNICHPSPDLDQAFVSVAEEMGYPVEIVEFHEFNQILLEDNDDTSFSMFKDVYKNSKEAMGTYIITKSLAKWLEGVEDFWVSKKIARLYPEFYSTLDRTVDNLKRDLMFAQKEGWFQKFGISRS